MIKNDLPEIRKSIMAGNAQYAFNAKAPSMKISTFKELIEDKVSGSFIPEDHADTTDLDVELYYFVGEVLADFGYDIDEVEVNEGSVVDDLLGLAKTLIVWNWPLPKKIAVLDPNATIYRLPEKLVKQANKLGVSDDFLRSFMEQARLELGDVVNKGLVGIGLITTGEDLFNMDDRLEGLPFLYVQSGKEVFYSDILSRRHAIKFKPELSGAIINLELNRKMGLR